VKSFPTKAPGGYFPTLEMAVANWKTGMTAAYKTAESMMDQQIEAILEMQALCQELMPETRELAARCADLGQLDRSMLMAAMPELPTGLATFKFKATAPVFGAAKALQ
jgi:hypothetical protein